MKKEIFMGLLVMLGLSFANGMPQIGPMWSVLAQTACQGAVAYQQTYNVVDSYPYQMWNGNDCVTPEMPYEYGMICEEVCDEESELLGSYNDAIDICGYYGEKSPQCINAMMQFYSEAATARSMFSTTKTAYLFAARQAIYAYAGEYCYEYPWPGVVSQDLHGFMSGYRECIEETSMYMSEFCSYCGSDPCDECMDYCQNVLYNGYEYCYYEYCYSECGAIITP